MKCSELVAALFGAFGFTAMGMFFVVLRRFVVYGQDPACKTGSTGTNVRNALKRLRGESRRLFWVGLGIYVLFLLIILGVLCAPDLMGKINHWLEKIPVR